MQKLGMPMFLLGVLIAACFASFPVRTPQGEKAPIWSERLGTWGESAGAPFALGLVLIVAGGLMSRAAARKARREPQAAAAGGPPRVDPRTLLGRIQTRLAGLTSEAGPKTATALHAELDTILEEEVPAFLEHRQSMIDALGLGTFAELIGQFATMERNAARAWSAITDEAWDEVAPSLERARTGLDGAIATWDGAKR
jgi:hypothetical protein